MLGDQQQPEHSTYSWASMLFCAGIGASLIYWGATEWVFYYVEPLFGLQTRSDAAMVWAASYGIFHWGPIGWAFYCLPAVALGCSYHLKGIPSLRLSAACGAVLRSQTDKWPGRVVDLLFIVGLLGWGSLGCALFFVVLGNYALFLELNDIYPVVKEALEAGTSTTVAGVIALLPMGSFWLVFVAMIGLIFMATSYDSASYTLAAAATRSMQAHEHPQRWHRVFWAVALGLLPISLLFVGGLRELQTASLVASIPWWRFTG